MGKKSLAVICGGKSTEHQISLLSSQSIINAVDKSKYELHYIAVDFDNSWYYGRPESLLSDNSDPKKIRINTDHTQVYLAKDSSGSCAVFDKDTNQKLFNPEVFFPIIHGAMGEDGTLQGMLRYMGVPFVGCDVLASAMCMDKDITKKVLSQAGIPVARSFTIKSSDIEKPTYNEIIRQLGDIVFVKPAQSGSSVGVSKVRTEEAYHKALAEAFQYDNKVLVEEAIPGKEVECAILGNDDPKPSGIGEVLVGGDFYSYGIKYLGEAGPTKQIPAMIPDEMVPIIQDLSVKAFKALECEGLSRIDFFLREDSSLILNEINTMPGFTQFSMYPLLWQESGIPYPDLIDRLIELAIEREEKRKF
jgi:D-alanine-D-alanine ligase